MRYIFFELFIFSILQFSIIPVYSQGSESSIEDEAQNALEKVVKNYDLTLSKNTFLYSGRLYNDNYSSPRAHQFFLENYWELGKLVCEEDKFDSVNLKYDIYNDLLLLENYTQLGSSPIDLSDKNIKEFHLFHHKFVYLNPPEESGLSAGFYDEVYTGEMIKIYSKRRKELDESIENRRIIVDFVEKDIFYLVNNDIYHRIKNKRSVIKLFKDHKNILKRFIRNEDLDFRQNFEEAVVKTVSYYETINE